MRLGQAVGAELVAAEHVEQQGCFCSSVPKCATGKAVRPWTLTPTPTEAHAAAITSSTCR